jgi:hypothetical protein
MNIKKYLINLLVFSSLLLIASPALAQVRIVNPLGGTDNFCKLLTSILSNVAILIGSLATIMIIWSGILFLTSAGSPERIGTAKKSLTFAVIGIAIAVSAGGIVATIKQVLNFAGATC